LIKNVTDILYHNVTDIIYKTVTEIIGKTITEVVGRTVTEVRPGGTVTIPSVQESTSQSTETTEPPIQFAFTPETTVRSIMAEEETTTSHGFQKDSENLSHLETSTPHLNEINNQTSSSGTETHLATQSHQVNATESPNH